MIEILDEHYTFDRADHNRIVAVLASVSSTPETFVLFEGTP